MPEVWQITFTRDPAKSSASKSEMLKAALLKCELDLVNALAADEGDSGLLCAE